MFKLISIAFPLCGTGPTDVICGVIVKIDVSFVLDTLQLQNDLCHSAVETAKNPMVRASNCGLNADGHQFPLKQSGVASSTLLLFCASPLVLSVSY
jgi:hypothetical protein